MRIQARCGFRVAFALAASAVAASALAQPSFTPLGRLATTGPYPSSEAWGVSADGSTVVGASFVSGHPLFGGTQAAFRWTAETGMVDIYNLSPIIGSVCRAYAVNADGNIVVGMANAGVLGNSPTSAFIWTPENGAAEIGDLPGGAAGVPRGAARGVSADGTILAGLGESDSGTEAFRYTVADSTFLGLGDLPDGNFVSSGFGISADGATIVGSSSTGNGVQAFRWVEGPGIIPLGHLPVAEGIIPFSEAYASNADGTVIVGLSRSLASGNSGWEAFRWTADEGVSGNMQGLGDLPGGAVMSAGYATNIDGSVVVGSAGIQGSCGPFGCQTASRAFIWDAANGLRDLNVVLTDMGVDLGGWVLQEARGISADGRVIVGTGIKTTNPPTNPEAWRVELFAVPPSCRADFNDDGFVNPDDLADFITCFFLDVQFPGFCAGADFNGDGFRNPDDLADFITTFFLAVQLGC